MLIFGCLALICGQVEGTVTKCKCVFLTLLALVAVVALTAPFALAQIVPSITYGDTNVEVYTTNLLDNYVDALTKIVVTQPTTITQVSMYLYYTGSDGSQCIKFGIYGDNGASWAQSNPLNEPLVASTHNAYCFVVGDFGPAWETWPLLPSDYMVVGPGTYWLATLASQDFGTIYRFTYTGSYGGQYLYKYGYFNYAFPASFTLGFPPVAFGNTTYVAGEGLILPTFPTDIGDYNAPYSFYVSGIPATPVPESSSPQILIASALLIPLLLTTWRKRKQVD